MSRSCELTVIDIYHHVGMVVMEMTVSTDELASKLKKEGATSLEGHVFYFNEFLENDLHTYYVFPTPLISRNDVTLYFKNKERFDTRSFKISVECIIPRTDLLEVDLKQLKETYTKETCFSWYYKASREVDAYKKAKDPELLHNLKIRSAYLWPIK